MTREWWHDDETLPLAQSHIAALSSLSCGLRPASPPNSCGNSLLHTLPFSVVKDIVAYVFK